MSGGEQPAQDPPCFRRGDLERERIDCDGVVKCWKEERGFGFVARDGKPDLFAHASDVKGDGVVLERGDAVTFTESVPG
eukprot:gene4296-2816_t